MQSHARWRGVNLDANDANRRAMVSGCFSTQFSVTVVIALKNNIPGLHSQVFLKILPIHLVSLICLGDYIIQM